MQHIRNADGAYSGSLQGGKQDAAQSIAERYTITTLKGADNKFTVISSLSLTLDFRHNHIRDTHHVSPLPVSKQ
jgi:hypothetical protein